MTRKPIEELIIEAARGEPMDVEERNRLGAALAACVELEADRRAQAALSEQLAALRAAMHVPAALSAREHALLEAFRTSRSRQRSYRKRLRTRVGLAAAASVLVALGLIAFLGGPLEPTTTASRPAVDGRAAAEALAVEPQMSQAAVVEQSPAIFHALPFSPSVTSSGSYSVVRVRIPVSSFPASLFMVEDSSVEADLLIGEDGIPSAIRFIGADNIFVSANTYTEEERR